MENKNITLHKCTPLIESTSLSELMECTVLLKLENCQPSASFKIRGIGHLCLNEKMNGKREIVCSSGGNAGMAAAYAARKLDMPCKVFVPASTPQFTIDKLKTEQAEVEVAGNIWDEANERALEYIQENLDCAFVHPFDNPLIWEGHSSIVKEIKLSMGEVKPDCIVASVGGGGLLTGIIQGIDQVGWSDVPVIAMETDGAASLAAAVTAGKVVSIPDITSIAKTLGSQTICQRLFDLMQSHTVLSQVVTDAEALSSCLQFADDHRMLVEPACGASLAAVYSKVLKNLQGEGKLGELSNVVIIVCGGNIVTMETLLQWKTLLNL